MELNVVGTGKPIEDARLKVTGQKQYVADMKLPGMLCGKILLSPIAHGKITSIDTSAAESLPGVRAVATYKNTPDILYNSAKRYIEHKVICNEKIFNETVRFVGERVAAVAADTEEIASAALKLIKVTYDKLPVVTNIREAILPEAYPIHHGGNIAARLSASAGDAEHEMEKCDYVLDGVYETPAIHHAAIEPHVALADWSAAGKLTVFSPNQNAFAFRVILSDIFGLPYSKIRVVSPAIGGAFGGKLEVTIEPVAAVLSKMSGRPVKIVLNRRETIMATRVRHASLNFIRTGFMKDGTIRAVTFKIYTNTGAYASSATNVAGALTHKVFMGYQIEHMSIEAIPVYTNTTIAGAMRGYGSPQVYFGWERQINKIAGMLKMDPAELQLKNMVNPDSLNPISHFPLGNPRPKDCLSRAMELIRYKDACQEQEASKALNSRYAVGVGLALGVHGNNCYGVHRDNSSPMIKMNEDGSCILYTGSHEMGTDTVGMQMQILSETLGISIDRIGTVTSDTDTCLWHIGDYSSRGVFVIGAAAKQSAEKMKRELQTEAAKLLNAEPETIEFGNNQAWVREEPERRASLREVMIYCQSVSLRELCVFETYQVPRGATSYGVHIAKVRVDRESGKTEVLDYVAVHDVGFVINPLMLQSQLHGGIHMGLGYALSEQITFDSEGVPAPLILKKYGILRTTDMPGNLMTDFIADKGGEPGGPYGAKALGECPVVPAAPAVLNAICNALDVEIDTLPALPERIKQALEKKEREI
jgi:CO/xanthine dehydrogenase Mo-binding subunit